MRLSRILFSRFPACITVITLLTATGSQSFAQEIGLEYGITDAGYGVALDQPAGFGGHLDIPIISNLNLGFADRIGILIAGSKHTEKNTIIRSRCSGLVPPGTDCSDDTFDGDAYISRIGAGVIITFKDFFPGIQPEIYAMGISTNLESSFIGRESGRGIGPYSPEDNFLGFELGAMLNYKLNRYLNLYGRFAMQDTNVEACATDVWNSFCEERKLYQFNIGTELRLSELFGEK